MLNNKSLENQFIYGILGNGTAKIILPNDNDSMTDIFHVIVNVTNAGDTLGSISGQIRRNNSWIANIQFQIYPNYTLAFAPKNSSLN